MQTLWTSRWKTLDSFPHNSPGLDFISFYILASFYKNIQVVRIHSWPLKITSFPCNQPRAGFEIYGPGCYNVLHDSKNSKGSARWVKSNGGMMLSGTKPVKSSEKILLQCRSGSGKLLLVSLAQWFLVPSHVGLMVIFYSLTTPCESRLPACYIAAALTNTVIPGSEPHILLSDGSVSLHPPWTLCEVSGFEHKALRWEASA